MSTLNVKITPGRNHFNWDNIEVGNKSLNHSENFFAQKHSTHERFLKMDEEQEMINTKMGTLNFGENKENIKITNSNTPVTLIESKPFLENVQSNIKKENVEYIDSKPSLKDDGNNIQIQLGKREAKQNMVIVGQWSSQKQPVQKIHAAKGAKNNNGSAPHAYNYKDVYERKKQEMIRQQWEEERKMREFHSRPAPDFSVKHEQAERLKRHAFTLPVTPKVLKHSRDAEERRKKKLEELQHKQQPIKCAGKSQGATVEQNFVQKSGSSHVNKQFSLNLERRLHDRKLFDMATQRALEKKRKEEEEERKIIEEKRIKELRKRTQFKARPNPFK